MNDRIAIECAVTSFTFPPDTYFGAEPMTFDVRSYALLNGDSVVLIDALLPDCVELIADALSRLGKGFMSVEAIILTHDHPDHVGSLDAIVEVAPRARVYAHAAEAGSISTRYRCSVRTIADKEVLHGLEIIGTPGHTSGHLSVLEPCTGTLFVGDAAVNMDGLTCSIAEFDDDHNLAVAQLGRLGGFDFQRCMFAHGDPIEAEAASAFRELSTKMQHPES